MNQLTTLEQSAIEKLPTVYRNLVTARQEPQIKNLDTVRVKSACAEILTKASYEMGSPMSDNPTILQFQTQSLYEELSGKYSTLTLSELRSAFKKGIRDEFGPYFGMCPKTYHQFIKSYFELPERGKAQLAYLELVKNENNTKEDKSLPPNLEGQKKVIEIYKQFIEKPINYTKKHLEEKIKKPITKSERDVYIQKCFSDFFQLHKKSAIRGANGNETRFIMFRRDVMEEDVEVSKIIETDETDYVVQKLKEYDLKNLPTEK